MYVLQLSALAAAFAAPAPKDPAPKEAGPPDLVGVWVCESITYNGRETPNPDLAWEFTAAGKLLLGHKGKERSLAGTYKVTAVKGPATFDWDTGDIGVKYWGIVKVEANVLTVCYFAGGVNDRPTRFDAPRGSGAQLVTFRRVTKDE
jgi:uncharacterized protein (TIGR03067 family)